MRKWSFWGLMCLVSLFHWLCFFQGTLEAFNKGIPGVDNQGALLFIPAFWVMAAAALIVFALWTLWIGRAWIERGYRFSLSGMIFFARRSRRVNLGEERVYVTLEEHSRMTVGTAEPWRN